MQCNEGDYFSNFVVTASFIDFLASSLDEFGTVASLFLTETTSKDHLN